MAGASPSHGTMVSPLLGDRVGPALQKNPVWLFLKMRNLSQGKKDKSQEENCYSLKKKKKNLAKAKQNLVAKKKKSNMWNSKNVDRCGRTGFLQQGYLYSVICEAPEHKSLFSLPVHPPLEQKQLKSCRTIGAKKGKDRPVSQCSKECRESEGREQRSSPHSAHHSPLHSPKHW